MSGFVGIAIAVALAQSPPFGNPANYPAEALKLRQEGPAVATLTIGKDGRVSACRIKESTGSPSLDQATCDIAVRRVRFTPAKDEQGEPTEGTFDLRLRWKLPE